MEFYPNEQEMKAIDCYIKDKKPPVVTSHDDRWKAPKGGRSDPDRPTAPDGVSGNWKYQRRLYNRGTELSRPKEGAYLYHK